MFKGAHLLKWLAAYCVLDNVGAAAVPWSSAELVASGSNSSVSQRLGRALGEERPCEPPGSCFEQKTYTSPTGKVYLPFQFCKTMPHSDLGMCLKEDVVHRTPEHPPHRLTPSPPRPHPHITHPQNPRVQIVFELPHRTNRTLPSPSPPHTHRTPSYRHPHPHTHPNLHSHSLALIHSPPPPQDKLTLLTGRASYVNLTLDDLEAIPQATNSTRRFENPFAAPSSPVLLAMSPAKINSEKQVS